MKSRGREEWALWLEWEAALCHPSARSEYLLEAARLIRCPDRSSFQGVRLTSGKVVKREASSS